MKLLISGLGGSLFPYLHNHLKEQFEIHYVDSDKQLSLLYPDFNFHHSPLVTDKRYSDFIKNIVNTKNIDFYIPLIDEEIEDAKNNIEGYLNVKVIAPTTQFTALCLNKFKLMQCLKDQDISVVDSYRGDSFNWELSPPIFVKPVSGRGSRGIRQIENADELSAYYLLENYKPQEIIIQPLLTGIEYTVGVLTSPSNEVMSISSKKVLRKKGITQLAITENIPAIDDIALSIIEKLKPCGPFNVQLILTPTNGVKVFEINPRFSTTTIMEIEGGVNPIKEFIAYHNKPYFGEILRPKSGLILHRRWENLFYEAK